MADYHNSEKILDEKVFNLKVKETFKLKESRKITFDGAITGELNFDGSSDVVINTAFGPSLKNTFTIQTLYEGSITSAYYEDDRVSTNKKYVVFFGGVMLMPSTDFTIENGKITILDAVTAKDINTNLCVYQLNDLHETTKDYVGLGDNSLMRIMRSNILEGNTISDLDISSDDDLVIIYKGKLLKRGTDYTIEGNTITLLSVTDSDSGSVMVLKRLGTTVHLEESESNEESESSGIEESESSGTIEYESVFGENTNQTLKFKIGLSMTNANIFCNELNQIQEDKYDVYINNSKTSQKLNNITANQNDIIEIKAKGIGYFPAMQNTASLSDACTACITEVYNPLPPMGHNAYSPVTNMKWTLWYCNRLTSLRSDLFINNPFVTTFDDTFGNCVSLTSLPADLFKYTPNVTMFNNTFYNCYGLTSVPENLFKYSTEVTHHSGTFYFCKGLRSVPANLFATNTKVTNFDYTFWECDALTTVPSNLFANNVNVESFLATFGACDAFTTVPSNLFANNTKVTCFCDIFVQCKELRTVPSNTFVNNALVDDFRLAFYNCSKLTSLPTLWTSHPNAEHNGCFYNCTSASNYNAANTAGWVEYNRFA